MTYITIQDLIDVCKDNIISDCLQLDSTITTGSTNTLLDNIETSIMAEVEATIGNRYDVKAMFLSGRSDNFLKSIMVDMMIYELESRVISDQISSIRIDKYNKAIQLLKDISTEKFSPPTFIHKNNTYDLADCILMGGNFRKTNSQY
jgi:hypothetical protein